MSDDDGSLPAAKFLLYAVIALAVGKVLWERLTEDIGQWITVDLWGLVADLPIMIALNGFTQPAIDFARHYRLILMGRPEWKRWAHGEHLYDVLGIQSTTR
ncbi:hypothetical protein [Streptomyces sp. NPDC055186]